MNFRPCTTTNKRHIVDANQLRGQHASWQKDIAYYRWEHRRV